MLSLNRVMLGGNLTRDPETRSTPGGSVICEFGLAINRKLKDKNETCFVSVTVWGKQAEACGKYLSKGSNVYIEGRLVFEQWEDRSGGKRNTLKVTADNVQFISSRDSGGQAQGDAQSSPRQRQGHPGVSEDYAPPPRNGRRYTADDCPPPQNNYGTNDDGGELPPF